MSLITVEDVSKQYSERLLLDQVNLLINEGDRIGLIGVNGSGKSTFLRLVAGLEGPDQGRVTIRGGIRIEYLPQEPPLDDSLTVLAQLFDSDSAQVRLLRDYEWASQQLEQQPASAYWQEQLAGLTDQMEQTGGWGAEANVKAILTRLGITDFAAPIANLSGGERKRVALARALIDRADLLILDEPTNHIDAETIAWLESYLASEPGALLMVTHDRYFLDRVVNRIVELDRRQLVSYPGNYSQYLEQSTTRHEQLASAEVKRQNLLRRELEWLRRGAQARSTKQKARKQRVEELQRIQYDQGEQVAINLAGRRLGKKVLAAQGLSKSFNSQPLFQNLNFELGPGERFGIIGPNGAGKSTFLDILAGKLAPDRGEVEWGETVHLGYYDQKSSALIESMRVIDFIEKEAPVIRAKDGSRMSAFQVLEWFLFPKPQQFAQIGTLSGGERRRLYLLFILMKQPNVLFLDEPTNDLDIQTLTVLEEFLDHFEGSLIVVSHDRYFLDRNVDFLIKFENGRMGARYPTPYSTFQQLQAQAEREASATSSPKPQADRPAKAASRPRKLNWREQQELSTLEAAIETLEGERARLQTEINNSGSDYTRLQSLAGQLQSLEVEIEAKTERWLELSEKDEG